MRDRHAADEAVSENQTRAHLQTKQVPSASGRQISSCWNVGIDPDGTLVTSKRELNGGGKYG